jgi:hypothetical protein
MKPFYSIDELCDLLGDNSDALAISDALIAANVKMVYAGKEADLSGWYPSRPKTDANGTVRITVGSISNPHPHEVIVATESLPESWKKKLKHNEDALTHDADKPITSDAESLSALTDALSSESRPDFKKMVDTIQRLGRAEQGRAGASAKLANDAVQAAKVEAFKLWGDWQTGKTLHKSGAAFALHVVVTLPVIQNTKTVERWVTAWRNESKNRH